MSSSSCHNAARGIRTGAAIALLLVCPLEARALTVLSAGKTAVFRERKGVGSALVRFGRDAAFASLTDPTCAGGGTMTVQIASYPVVTYRVDAQEPVALPCAGWRARGDGFVYRDSQGSAGGVRKVTYGRRGFGLRIDGGTYRHVVGPVGYVEAWIEIGGQRLNGRFHSFRANDATRIVTRKPSATAAAGEAGFWTVLHGDDHSEAKQQETLRNLTKAVKRDPKDGWSRFLLGMLHLYRFGQGTVRYDEVSDAARADLVAANAAFEEALPRLWDGSRGDSRVPGFVAAAKFGLGVVQNDAALQAEGLADIEAAVAVNAFFNVFDLIPVVQALPPSDPRFAQVFPLLRTYISDPNTLSCVLSQPEICADMGLAPRNIAGALMLFGDVFVKAGALDPDNVAQAEGLYYPVAAFGASAQPNYLFTEALAERVGPGKAAARAALYQDADPSNDPPIIGAGPEACAVCHYR